MLLEQIEAKLKQQIKDREAQPLAVVEQKPVRKPGPEPFAPPPVVERPIFKVIGVRVPVPLHTRLTALQSRGKGDKRLALKDLALAAMDLGIEKLELELAQPLAMRRIRIGS